MKYLPYVLTPGHEVQRLYRTCHLLLSEAVCWQHWRREKRGNNLITLFWSCIQWMILVYHGSSHSLICSVLRTLLSFLQARLPDHDDQSVVEMLQVRLCQLPYMVRDLSFTEYLDCSSNVICKPKLDMWTLGVGFQKVTCIVMCCTNEELSYRKQTGGKQSWNWRSLHYKGVSAFHST